MLSPDPTSRESEMGAMGEIGSGAAPRVRLIAHCGNDASATLIREALTHTDFDAHVTSSGPELRHTLAALLADGSLDDAGRAIVVMPMTSGRNLTLISDTAKVCQWEARNHPSAELCLADAPLTTTTTLAWLRQGLRKHTSNAGNTGNASIGGNRAHNVAIITSAAIDPFSDAELFRIARLAWTNSSGADVAVAFDDAAPRVDEVKALYSAANPATQFSVIRADLNEGDGQHRLIGPATLATPVTAAAQRALHLLRDHHDNGIEASLMADHEHGYAHSHGDEEGHGHSHDHFHGHSHGHFHSHGHGHAHSHAYHQHDHADGETLHIHLGGDDAQ